MTKVSPQEAADSCLQFADCVGLKKAAKEGKNFVFSPVSIRAALCLAAAGAGGATLDQFLSYLGSSTIEDLNSATEKLMSSVRTTTESNPNPNGGGSLLTLVNSMWVDQSLALKPSFMEIADSVYDAEAKSVDFIEKACEAVNEVNAWVENKTNGLVKELIPPNEFSEETRVILVNALYFKGTWLSKFYTNDTFDAEFHLLNGTNIMVPFMSNSYSNRLVALFDGFKVLRMRYEPNKAGREFSMLVFLPDKKDGLGDLVRKAISDSSFFNHHIPTEAIELRRFRIPKFKMSCGFKPADVLRCPDMGLLDIAFTTAADFSRMSDTHKFYISCVRHKATIEVEEEGTVAAAATDVSDDDVGFSMCDDYTPPTVDFVADHPFMFAIREDQTGAVLFLGHVVNLLYQYLCSLCKPFQNMKTPGHGTLTGGNKKTLSNCCIVEPNTSCLGQNSITWKFLHRCNSTANKNFTNSSHMYIPHP